MRGGGNRRDLTGQRFGRWTALRATSRRTPSGGVYWICRCDCGAEREVAGINLLKKRSLCCGCPPQERIARDAEIVRRYQAGETIIAIGAVVGLTPSAVAYIVRRAKVAMRTGADYADVPLSTLKELHAQGLTLSEISRRTGLDVGGLCRRFKVHGLRVRARGRPASRPRACPSCGEPAPAGSRRKFCSPICRRGGARTEAP
jgi:hypothetical protein